MNKTIIYANEKCKYCISNVETNLFFIHRNYYEAFFTEDIDKACKFADYDNAVEVLFTIDKLVKRDEKKNIINGELIANEISVQYRLEPVISSKAILDE